MNKKAHRPKPGEEAKEIQRRHPENKESAYSEVMPRRYFCRNGTNCCDLSDSWHNKEQEGNLSVLRSKEKKRLFHSLCLQTLFGRGNFLCPNVYLYHATRESLLDLGSTPGISGLPETDPRPKVALHVEPL